jgi:uncharacterized protein (DUF488 family)
VGLLGQHSIELIVDVRSYPSSRRWPQFNQGALEGSLAAKQIAYRWLSALGGRRHSKRGDSRNAGWELEAFRSYADFAAGEEFERGLSDLLVAAPRARAAIMCAEGLWWQCHRRIISDHLTTRGYEVMHILPQGRVTAHKLTEFAVVEDGRLVYPARQHDLPPAGREG